MLGKVCIGFNIGNLAKGIIYTESPEGVKVISKESLIVRNKAQKLIEDSMWKYDHIGPYDKRINKGFWRILLYRESKITKEVLISFVVSEENDVKDDELEQIQAEIVKAFPLGSKVNDLSVKSVSMIFANEISGAYKDGDKIVTL